MAVSLDSHGSPGPRDLLYQRIGGREGIFNLIKHFYADVRQDPLIGPVFNAQIKDWKAHLDIIASFWETLMGGPRTYARPMPLKHVPLQLQEAHFERWLFLWQANCRAQLPPCVAREMIDLAHHIAGKLRLILRVSDSIAPVASADVRTNH
ncbi:MAG: group III truncated hemoglobin [Verrucomicrobia bacterium]|nr:group III truncated hemoglobin [Verrucomicrobiota bacterium]